MTLSLFLLILSCCCVMRAAVTMQVFWGELTSHFAVNSQAVISSHDVRLGHTYDQCFFELISTPTAARISACQEGAGSEILEMLKAQGITPSLELSHTHLGWWHGFRQSILTSSVCRMPKPHLLLQLCLLFLKFRQFMHQLPSPPFPPQQPQSCHSICPLCCHARWPACSL